MGFGDAIKHLYSQFILRDVLSSITPGAIVVLTAFLLVLPEPSLAQRMNILFDYSRAIHWILYIPIFGLFYVTGFAIECLERLFGCVRFYTSDASSFMERWAILCGRLADNPDLNRQGREGAIKFLWMTKDDDWAIQDYERKIILKQTCANNFGAIILAGLLLLVDTFLPLRFTNLTIVALVTLFLLLALYWGYRDFTIAVTTTERYVGSLHNEGKLEGDK